MKTCIITYTNEKFVSKIQTMISEIREIGKYDGDIVVIIGEDLKDRLQYEDDETYYYDYTERDGLNYTEYIMLKRAHTCPHWSF